MATFTVKPTDGSEPYDITADSVEFDKQTGAACFYNGTGDDRNLVARLLNVSFFPQQSTTTLSE